MFFRMGTYTRPQDEVVVTVSYRPIYSMTRRLVSMVEAWNIQGRVVLVGSDCTAASAAREMNLIDLMFTQSLVDLAVLDDSQAPTPYLLRAAACSEGPNTVDFAWVNQPGDVFGISQAYQAVVEATRPISAGTMQFNESISPQAGGPTMVWVGGAINPMERQIGSQYSTYKYTQSGMAVGLLGYPTPPQPIWPWAMNKPEQARLFRRESPRNVGQYYSTDFAISWQYDYEWNTPLIGEPNQLV